MTSRSSSTQQPAAEPRLVYAPFQGYVREPVEVDCLCGFAVMLTFAFSFFGIFIPLMIAQWNDLSYTPADYWALCAQQHSGQMPEGQHAAWAAGVSTPSTVSFGQVPGFFVLLIALVAARVFVDAVHWGNATLCALGETPQLADVQVYGFHPFYGAAGVNMLRVWAAHAVAFAVFVLYVPIVPEHYTFMTTSHAREACDRFLEPGIGYVWVGLFTRLAALLISVVLGVTVPYYEPASMRRW